MIYCPKHLEEYIDMKRTLNEAINKKYPEVTKDNFEQWTSDLIRLESVWKNSRKKFREELEKL